MSSNTWHSMRASDAERERAADVIRAALAEGRLSQEEHAARLQDVFSARTYGELERAVRDLPTGVGPSELRPTPPDVRSGHLPAAYVPAARKTNDLALASAVCGGLGFMTGVTAIPAIITGHMALSRINHTGEEGRGLAIAGLIMGYGLTVGGLLLVMMFGVFAVLGLGFF